jgi:hypothetical protein
MTPRRKLRGVQAFPGNALGMRPMEILYALQDMKGNAHALWLLSTCDINVECM